MNSDAELFDFFDLRHISRRLSYGPETGVFIWRSWRGGNNTRNAGNRAGGVNGEGYRRIRITTAEGKVSVYEHHLAWLFAYGEWPRMAIDHADGDRANNAITNLRLATPVQNSANARPRQSKSGVKGVFWDEKRGFWTAQITIRGKQKYLGKFYDPDEAARAYQTAATAAHGEFARWGRYEASTS